MSKSSGTDFDPDVEALLESDEKEPLIPASQEVESTRENRQPTTSKKTVKKWTETIREKRDGKRVLVEYSCVEHREELQVSSIQVFVSLGSLLNTHNHN